MEINEIKSKIKKLLALHEDHGNDNESYVALMRAQELMAKYKLDKSDITEEEKKHCIRRETTIHYGTRSSDHYMNELATIIADNFCCVNYVSTTRGTKTHYVCFMGMEDDVIIAEDAFYTANSAIIRGYNRLYKELCRDHHMDYIPAKYFNPVKQGYVEGYLAGLSAALESQKDKHQEWGLVLVAPQEAKDFVNNLKEVGYSRVTLIDNTYYDEGYSDGINFHLNKKINTPEIIGVLEGN